MGTNIDSYFGRGMKLDGISQSVITDMKITDPNNCTISVYIYNIGTVAGKVIYSGHALSINTSVNNKININYNNGTAWVNNYINFTPGQYTVTVTNSRLKLYINNIVMLDIMTGGIVSNIYPIAVGCRVQGSENTDATIGTSLVFDYPLTPEQIKYQYEYPETFLYREDDILKSKILNQQEIDAVKVFMPMVDTDGYARNLVTYSEGINDTSSPVMSIDGAGNTITYADGVFTLHQENVTTVHWRPFVGFTNTFGSDELWLFEATFSITNGTAFIYAWEYGDANGDALIKYINHSITAGDQDYKIRFIGNIRNNNNANLIIDGTKNAICDLTIKYSAKKLTGTHEISNYTNSVRDAINLPTGLQTSKWKRDLLGVPNGLSNGLECDGVGYLDTGWSLDPNNDFTIEFLHQIELKPVTRSLIGNSYQGFYVKRDFNSNNLISLGGAPYIIHHSHLNFNSKHIYTIVYTHTTESAIIYKDGVYLANLININITDTSSVFIGKSSYNSLPSNGFNGLFKVHPKAMTAQEVKYRYEQHVKAGLLN